MSNRSRIAIFIILMLGAFFFLLPNIYASGRLAFDPEFIHVLNTEWYGFMHLLSYVFWGVTVFVAFIIYGVQKFKKTKQTRYIILIVILYFVLEFPIIGLALLGWNGGWIQMMIFTSILFVVSIGIGLFILLSNRNKYEMSS